MYCIQYTILEAVSRRKSVSRRAQQLAPLALVLVEAEDDEQSVVEKEGVVALEESEDE